MAEGLHVFTMKMVDWEREEREGTSSGSRRKASVIVCSYPSVLARSVTDSSTRTDKDNMTYDLTIASRVRVRSAITSLLASSCVFGQSSRTKPASFALQARYWVGASTVAQIGRTRARREGLYTWRGVQAKGGGLEAVPDKTSNEDGAEKGRRCHYCPANMHKLAGGRHAILPSRGCAQVAANAEAQDDAESTPYPVAPSPHSSSKYHRSPLIPFAYFEGAGGQDALSFSTLS